MVGRTQVGEVLLARHVPYLTEDNTAFWTGGEHGRLMIHQCQACSTWIHPAAPVCRVCHSLDVQARQVSGRAHLVSYTVNEQAWSPGQHPYIVGWAELVEQTGLILTTNIVDTDSADIAIGAELTVVFEKHPTLDIWYPLFQPVGGPR